MRRHRVATARCILSLSCSLLFLPFLPAGAQTSLTGYLQTEWQHYDQSSNPDGRAFYSDSRKDLFTIRRGRLKVTHQDSAFKMVMQSDFTERGFELKDAFLEVSLLKKNQLNVTVGLFNRLNFEVERSSSSRESTERSQVVRAFYPGERDLGFKFESTQQLGKNFAPKIQLALFNGTQQETDALKDIAARLILPLPLGTDSKIKATVGGSYYIGGVPQPEDSLYKYEGGAKVLVFEERNNSWAGWANRQNIGLEAQIEADLLPIGKSALYAEFLAGTRPEQTVRAPQGIIDAIIPTLILRKQAGYYAMVTQELSKKYMLAAKYDFFDKNTELSGTEVQSSRDRAATVIGFGLLGSFGPIRITAWYEIPTFAADEAQFTDGSGELKSDDLKDNKTTIRFQYKFK